MIGQAVINVKSGGRKTAFYFDFRYYPPSIHFCFFKSVMVAIPTAALIGIMMTVAVDTFDWESLRLFPNFLKLLKLLFYS